MGDPPLASTSDHSYGLHLPTQNSTKLTVTNATITHAQTRFDSGYINENTPGFSLSGLLIIILIPVNMNGLVKWTTLWRSCVIVSGARAMSAFCRYINWFEFSLLNLSTLFNASENELFFQNIM